MCANKQFLRRRSRALLLLIPLVALSLASCAKIDPRQVDVDLPTDMPEIKETSFDKPLADLGEMTRVYGKRAFIQGKDITDLTGLSQYGFGEIPRDITEMTKSALNAIGGNVVYIPYNPVFINNQVVTGYSNFQGKLIPDIVLSGGITEFDRGLKTHSSNTDFGVTTRPFNVDESWVPGDTISVDWGYGDKDSLARITLDFNLLDFRTMSGVARMQTVNSINVYKALAEKELGFTIFGPSFGLKGTVKKVQGRHAAIRLLVQTSVLQIVGKYLYLPYWKLVPGMQPDPVVIDRIRQDYRALSDQDKIAEIQTCLYLKGHNISVNGRMDAPTREALSSFKPDWDPSRGVHDPELYVALWSSLADNLEQTAHRRELLARHLAADSPVERVAAAPTPAKAKVKAGDDKVAQRKANAAPAAKAAPAKKPAPAGPTEVAKRPAAGAADRPAVAQTAPPPAPRPEQPPEDLAQVTRRPLILGGTNFSAEAIINERRTAE